ncbi:MAG: response regulator [Alphaproteobacteria bacterium]|nr:response regulator [Alphaproteobacteria bacterium]
MATSWTKTKFTDFRILIVDDEPLIIKMVEAVLHDLGIRTIYKAGNGFDALDYFAESVNVIDLVICDWMMPEMDGLEFLHHLRAKHLETPFIMLTSRTEPGHIIAAKDFGASGYIAKPFNAAELRDKIEKIITKLLKKKEFSPSPDKKEG